GAAAAGAGREVLRERAGLTDVLRCDPEVGAVEDRCAVVTPARPGRVRSVVEGGAAESVRRADARGRDLHGTGAVHVERGERRARVEVAADEREGDDALAAR